MDFDSCNIAVKASCEAAMSLGGVVVGLSGSSLNVSWNASKRCTGHTMAGLSFVAQLHQRTESIMRVGIATGAVQHGNFGTQKNRFATVFGVALESAAAVADLAYELGTYSLFADCTPGGKALDVSVKACCRLVDLWYSTSDKLKIQVMKVDESAMLQRMGMWEEEDPDEAARAQKQGQAIRQFCSRFAADEHGAREYLMELSALAEKHDDELLKVFAPPPPPSFHPPFAHTHTHTQHYRTPPPLSVCYRTPVEFSAGGRVSLRDQVQPDSCGGTTGTGRFRLRKAQAACGQSEEELK